MGGQTDAHIAAVNLELKKLKDEITTMQTADAAFDTLWTNMMRAYDGKPGGRSASMGYRDKLKTEAKKHDDALEDSKTALKSAQQAVASFDTFVTQKDASTINPFKKKSIKKAKTFVEAAKAELHNMKLDGKSKMTESCYNIGLGIYY